MTVVLYTHQDAFNALELTCDNADGMAGLALQLLGINKLKTVLIAQNDIHEGSHLTLWHLEWLAVETVVKEITTVSAQS